MFRSTTRGIVCIAATVLSVSVLLASRDSSRAAAGRGQGAWTSATGKIGRGPKGHIVTILRVRQDNGDVIVGLASGGLWKSSNGGITWSECGREGQILSTVFHITMDPQDNSRFWFSCLRGRSAGLYRTADGGQTIDRIPVPVPKGIRAAYFSPDAVAVDFTDPERQSLVVGVHENWNSLVRTDTGGRTWKYIGANAPPNTNLSTNTLFVGPNTLVVGSRKPRGMYRTTDGGDTWRKTSDFGSPYEAKLYRNGTILAYEGGHGFVRSIDRGMSWHRIPTRAAILPVELPDGRLVTAAGGFLQISSNGGRSWRPIGSRIPFPIAGMDYYARGHILYAFSDQDAGTSALAIVKRSL